VSPILESIGSVKGFGWGALVAGSSYESIATATGTGSSGLITFSSIPSTYSHLQIRGIFRSSETTGTNIYINLINNDSGSNYTAHRTQGDGSSATAAGAANQPDIFAGRAPGTGTTTGTMGVIILDIHDYASTTKYKNLRMLSGQDSNGTYAGLISLRSGLWMNTNAINSISFDLGAGVNFSTSTTFALYGIKG
jgi:hypothetical protein